MPKQRLHYQKTFLQKTSELFFGSFLAKSVLFKRMTVVCLTFASFLLLFFAANYQNQNFAIGEPSPSTVKAEKRLVVEQGRKKIIFKTGQIIVKKGEVVSTALFDALVKQQDLSSQKQFKIMIAGFSLAVLCYLLLGLYLSLGYRDLFKSLRMTSVLSLIIIGTLGIGLISKQISQYFTIVPAAVIDVALLFNPPVAFSVGLVCALLTGLLTGNPPVVLLVGILGSLVAVLVAGKHKENNTVIRTALALAASMALLSFLISVINNPSSLTTNLTHGFYGFISGIASTILALGSMPFFESLFGITTNNKLFELMQGNKILLRKLLAQAPGTYNHSLNVSSMAESVAPLIGADPLLTKVGGLYHDIGKIRRPYFFIENQVKNKNVYDEKKAELSYLIITAHVREGIEIAKKYDLPDEVIDIIKQHHGTTVVQFFYNLAKKTNTQISEDDYRYHEEKPKSKEAALIMLADSVEAAARSYVKPTEEEIKNMVEGLINHRIEDNQLTECNLNHNDIKIIKEKYRSFLISVYHPRLKYPERDDPLAEDKVEINETDKHQKGNILTDGSPNK